MRQKIEFPDYKSHASAIRALMAKGAVFTSSVSAGRYFVECEKNALRRTASGKTGKVRKSKSKQPRKFPAFFRGAIRALFAVCFFPVKISFQIIWIFAKAGLVLCGIILTLPLVFAAGLISGFKSD